MWFPLVKRNHCALSILCLMVFWCFCADGAPSLKDDDGKTEILEVEKGTVEKRLLCAVRPDWAGYRWFKNDRIIEVRANRKKYRIKKYQYLKIKNIILSDEGIYVCQSYNSEENYVNKTVYLNVVAAPTFTHPEEMKAMQKFDKDNPPILVCKADGNPKPTVLWYKENERITNKSGEISANRFTLRVKSSNAKDKIKYRCLVSNKYGNISYEFVIDVPEVTRFSPIIEVIQNQSVVVGGNLAVECKAAASELPEFNLVQYLPNGSEIPAKIGGKIKRRLPKQQEENDVFWYTVWWDFENVSFTDEKYYACTAKNRDFGISTQRFYVLVVPKAFFYSVRQYSPTPYEVKKVSGTQRNGIIGIICTIVAGLALLGVVACVVYTNRRRKRKELFERYRSRMLDEMPDAPSINQQPSAHCWKEVSYTPQIQLTTELEMFLVAPKRTEMKNFPINQSLRESTV